MPDNIYDIIVVGGGISGLYAIYKLIKKYENINETEFENDTESKYRLPFKILLIEKDSQFGGRIQTKYNQGHKSSGIKLQYDIGPARISTNHHLAIKLIDAFKLKKASIQPFKKHRHITGNGNKNGNDNGNDNVIIEKDISVELIKKTIDGAKKISNAHLHSMSFKDLADKVLGLENSIKLQDMFGYDAEFKYCNAYDAVEMFKKDFEEVGSYFVLKNGLHDLVESLSNYINQFSYNNSKRNNKKNNILIKIIKNKKIVKFQYDNFKNVATIFGEKSKKNSREEDKSKTASYQGKKLIWAVPQKQLLEINGWSHSQQELFEYSVRGIPLHRIFCQFPCDENKGTSWISGIGRTTTNDAIRQFIPMIPKIGFAQVSYSDTHYADYWNKFATKSKTALINELMKHFKIVFSEINNIEKPIFIDNKYWPEGVHMWKPGVNSTDLYNKILHIGNELPNGNNLPIYIIGEAYSKHQCWIEGALETVEDLFKIL